MGISAFCRLHASRAFRQRLSKAAELFAATQRPPEKVFLLVFRVDAAHFDLMPGHIERGHLNTAQRYPGARKLIYVRRFQGSN
jgi:hypothetical protein